jgi:hypothetical protein
VRTREEINARLQDKIAQLASLPTEDGAALDSQEACGLETEIAELRWVLGLGK